MDDRAAARSFTSALDAFEGRATAPMVAGLRELDVGNARLASDTDRALKAARIIEMLSGAAELDNAAWSITVPKNLRVRPHAKWKRQRPPRSRPRDP